MPTDYENLHNSRDLESELRDAHEFMADMYSETAHFVVELLQNAEDALGKRPEAWNGDRTVAFSVSEDCVEVCHYGRPFSEDDVRGIALTLRSTKTDDLNDIGRFGVGFKSVFGITSRPEIHSGDENFAIEGRIKPVKMSPVPEIDPEQTLFRLPLNDKGLDSRQGVIDKLAELELRTLLFLRHIDGIVWQTSEGQKGEIRRRVENCGDYVRISTLTRKNSVGAIEESERWVVFSRPIAHGGKPAGSVDTGSVDIAFRFAADADDGPESLDDGDSKLTVFFPTQVPTNLGFLAHGSYRTTPNRETVPVSDDWNKSLMRETATLIPDALRWLKDKNLLTAEILDGFPIRASFAIHDRFSPLYDATKVALASRSLLPCSNGSYRPAGKTRLGSTDALRQLFSPRQLAEIYGESGHLFWISGDITENRFGELRQYIRAELNVTDLTPDGLIRLLRSGRTFLESQSDKWISRLYEFLAPQQALHERLKDVPLLRLENGRHIAISGEIKAFLPGKASTAAHTIRKSVCATSASLQFLQALGLSEREPVDDVIESVLPKYQADPPDASDYDADVHRIINAYKEVSNARAAEFLDEIRSVNFVKAIDAATGFEQFVTPEEMYLADAERIRLFAGVNGVLFTSIAHDVLNTSDAREMLEECGATPSDDMASIVVKYVLPKYQGAQINVNVTTYARDIKIISMVYELASDRRSYLQRHLRNSRFVKAIDAGSGAKSWNSPSDVYLATGQLRELFAGVEGVSLVDFKQSNLRNENINSLFKSCDASSTLRKVAHKTDFAWDERRALREKAGCIDVTHSEVVNDFTLHGLYALLNALPGIDKPQRSRKANLLWESLCDLADEDPSDFYGNYRWFYYEQRSTNFDAAFVRKLNDTAWIPDRNGVLRRPASILFDSLGWRQNEFLATKIRFQPPAVQELARETGIEVGAIELLQKEDLSEADLLELIAIKNQRDQPPVSFKHDEHHRDVSIDPQPRQSLENADENSFRNTANRSETTHSVDANSSGAETNSDDGTNGSSGGRAFESYIAARRSDPENDSDPDRLEHQDRMSLEAKAVKFILELEPEWNLTPTHNPGYDLYQVDQSGTITVWCEVKAMQGTFANRPATMTSRQFREAQRRGKAYWLYVVENAASDSPTLVKINDPAGHASTFTFDKGWLEIAEIVQ